MRTNSPRDKQLRDLTLDQVLKKRSLDQALNAKEFAVLVGVSYSTAREWFHLPGFPALQGMVFWPDFVQWRKSRTGLTSDAGSSPSCKTGAVENGARKKEMQLPPRAARILIENS